MFPFEVRGEVNREETRGVALSSYSEDGNIVAWSFWRNISVWQTVRRSHGRTYGRIYHTSS